MQLSKLAIRVVASLGLSLSAASAADLSSGNTETSYKDGVAGDSWVVTLGALGGAAPLFPGSKNESVAVFPVVDIHRPGAIEWLSLPTDPASITFFNTANFRTGAAIDYLFNRNASDTSALRGLRDIDYTIELGGFAEYYPAPFLRLRADLLQGVTGADGFEGRLKADFIYQAGSQWIFTAGPRLDFVNAQYSSTFFSVSNRESIASLLPTYHASGGLNSAGIDASARYYVTDNFSLRGFADFQRLVGDDANSPIVRYRGSADQFEFGLGAAFRFNYSH